MYGSRESIPDTEEDGLQHLVIENDDFRAGGNGSFNFNYTDGTKHQSKKCDKDDRSKRQC